MRILVSLLVLTTSFQAFGDYTNEPECGRSVQSMEGRIAGGRDALEGEFPWQVSLQVKFNNSHYCGGSLITPDIILTAAHCVISLMIENEGSVSVQAGLLDLRHPGTYSQRRTVSRFIMHESYGKFRYDIALLKLDAPFDLAASEGHIGTVCLPPEEQTISGDVTVTGWGYITSGGPASPTLLAVKVPVQGDVRCRNFGKDLYNPTLMFCAGVREKSACHGDSGGPAVQRKDGVSTVVGIVSFGAKYGCQYFPVFYTRISNYMPWIHEQIAELRSN